MRGKNVSLLIDIQDKIKQGKGGGYAHWATVFNLKESARTLVFLQENGIDDYAELEKRTADACDRFDDLSVKIKSTEKRLAAVTELLKYISDYGRTREVYIAYRKAGYSAKFRSQYEREIVLHQAAKKFFDGLGLKKLPAVDSLKQEYAALTAQLVS